MIPKIKSEIGETVFEKESAYTNNRHVRDSDNKRLQYQRKLHAFVPEHVTNITIWQIEIDN